MGVWIETEELAINKPSLESHPVWVCGLKLKQDWYTCNLSEVTPCMGVWIETP